MHAHTERPVQFPCRIGEGVGGKEDREESGQADREGTQMPRAQQPVPNSKQREHPHSSS